MSRRDVENVTPGNALDLALETAIAHAELPAEWTVEHVAARMIGAFETLLQTPVAVGPATGGNGWPTVLQEFADLIDEEAFANARAAFARARRRPKAVRIAMMDEALAWPMRFGAGEPLSCDAVQVWALCKAGRFSLAGLLRRRAAWAKLLAGNMTIAENSRREEEKARRRAEIYRRSRRLAEEWRINDRGPAGRAEGVALLKARAAVALNELDAELPPVTIAPHEAVPNKVLSRTSLDRHLPRGLDMLRRALIGAGVPVR